MSKQSQPDKTVDLMKVRAKNNLQQLTQRWTDSNDVVFRLCRRLQLTLDPGELLEIFAEELATLVSFDSLTYQYAEQSADFVYSVGYGGRHSCDYSLVLEDQRLGELALTRRQRFIEQELILIEQLAAMLAISLRNAWRFSEAQTAALTDTITGLGNRRLMDQELVRELHRARRHSSSFSVILCDLDHFKRVNDTYGHVNGDRILATAAQVVQASVRSSDACYRFGGEEMAVLLPSTGLDDACIVAERIRVNIARSPLVADPYEIRVTTSAGVSSFTTDDTVATLVQRADAALYRAKRQGRNCVVSDRSVTSLPCSLR